MKRLLPMVMIIIILIAGYLISHRANKSLVIDSKDKIEVEVRILVKNTNDSVIEGVELILIGYDGNIIDSFKTDSKGEVIEKISVELDNRYSKAVDDGLAPRGTITILAFKEGYRETVLFEAGVSEGSYFQSILMNPIVDGERNEPDVYLGNSHHLEIISFVNKYAKLIGREIKDY